MAQVEIYTTPICPYCVRAKRLLDRKGVAYQEVDVMLHPHRRDEMSKRAEGRYTVPQIFINGEGVGGCDELFSLEADGELDAMLAEGQE